MKIKSIIAIVAFLAISSMCYCKELDILYTEINQVVKNKFNSSEKNLDNKLVYTNLSGKLEKAYIVSLGEEKYIDNTILSDEELNKKIANKIELVNFEQLIISVKADTEVSKKMPCNKMAARRWLKDYEKSREEIKNKQQDLKNIQSKFNLFDKKYKFLNKKRKIKFYTYLCSIVNDLNGGNYSSARSLSEYIARTIFN